MKAIIALLAALCIAAPAIADSHGHYHGHGHVHYSNHYHGYGPAPFLFGAITGAIIYDAIAAPRYYAQPEVVYVQTGAPIIAAPVPLNTIVVEVRTTNADGQVVVQRFPGYIGPDGAVHIIR